MELFLEKTHNCASNQSGDAMSHVTMCGEISGKWLLIPLKLEKMDSFVTAEEPTKSGGALLCTFKCGEV